MGEDVQETPGVGSSMDNEGRTVEQLIRLMYSHMAAKKSLYLRRHEEWSTETWEVVGENRGIIKLV